MSPTRPNASRSSGGKPVPLLIRGSPNTCRPRRRVYQAPPSPCHEVCMTAPYDSQVTEERVIVVVRPRAILLVVALALLALGFLVVADAASQVAERVLVAGVLASLVRPLTLRFARRMPLGIAAALTVTVVLAGFALLSAVEIRDLVTETHRLKVAVPARIEQLRTELEPEHPVRRFIEQAEVEPRIREWLGQLPARIVLGTDNPAKGAGRVTGALLVTVLTMFTITRGAQSVKGGIALFRHRRVRQALERIVRAAYVGG